MDTIEDLQARIAFLDDAHNKLNTEVFRQSRLVDDLQKKVEEMSRRLQQMADMVDVDDSPHQPPPHY